MKRILIVAFLSLYASTTFAQSKKDSVEVTIDTLNLSGIVIDEFGNPLKNIKVNTTFSRLHTFTDANGKFYFPSINTTERIYVIYNDATSWEAVNGSRFIKFIVKPMPDHNINMQGYGYREYQIINNRTVKKPTKR